MAMIYSSEATFDVTQKYRYALTRIWDKDLPVVCWILLNPSTADAAKNDPTIRKCIGFSERWGYGGIEVVNLFAFRSSSPTEMKSKKNPIGPDNDKWIIKAIRSRDKIICGWGNDGVFRNRGYDVTNYLLRHKYAPLCLGRTKIYMPKHPLYIKYDTELVPYDCCH